MYITKIKGTVIHFFYPTQNLAVHNNRCHKIRCFCSISNPSAKSSFPAITLKSWFRSSISLVVFLQYITLYIQI